MDGRTFAARPPARPSAPMARWGTALVLGGLGLAVQAADLPSYRCQSLGYPEGTSVGTNALNNRGQVVGLQVQTYNLTRAMAWDKHGRVTAVYSGPNGADWTQPAGINDDGVVAGTGTADYTGPNARSAAYVWVDGTATLLPGHEEGGTWAAGINRSGQVVGYRHTGDGVALATLWTNGQVVTLPPLVPGGSAYAVGISNRGDVAGSSATATPDITHAVRWRDGEAIELDVLQGMQEAEATAISPDGDIVGRSWRPDASRAVIWKGRKAHVLRVPPHTDSPVPTGINKRGEIVGRSWGFGPLYWASADAVAVNVNDLITAGACLAPDGQRVELWEVVAINDRGEAVGAGNWTPRGGTVRSLGFKLVPQAPTGAGD